MAGCRGSAPARAQLIHRCKTTSGEMRGCRGLAPCPCPNPRNPAWNRDQGFAISHMREGSGTEANSRANLSRRQGVKPTSPGERQPQRDSFQICAPLCRNPKVERFQGRRCGCLKIKKSLQALFYFQGRSRISGAPSLARRELCAGLGFYSRGEFWFGRGRGLCPLHPCQGT